MSDIPDIYTNAIRVTASLYEIAITLQLQSPAEGDDIKVEEVGRVRMSPQQAMALYLLLDKHLKAYGDQFQEIFLPEDLVKRLSGTEEVGDTDERETDNSNN